MSRVSGRGLRFYTANTWTQGPINLPVSGPMLSLYKGRYHVAANSATSIPIPELPAITYSGPYRFRVWDNPAWGSMCLCGMDFGLTVPTQGLLYKGEVH